MSTLAATTKRRFPQLRPVSVICDLQEGSKGDMCVSHIGHNGYTSRMANTRSIEGKVTTLVSNVDSDHSQDPLKYN